MKEITAEVVRKNDIRFKQQVEKLVMEVFIHKKGIDSALFKIELLNLFKSLPNSYFKEDYTGNIYTDEETLDEEILDADFVVAYNFELRAKHEEIFKELLKNFGLFCIFCYNKCENKEIDAPNCIDFYVGYDHFWF